MNPSPRPRLRRRAAAGLAAAGLALAGTTLASPSAPSAASEGGAVSTDGPASAVAWGANAQGQTTLPPALAGETVTAVSAGDQHSLALTAEGDVVAWGSNAYGQTTIPAALTAEGVTVTDIAAGQYHSLALTSAGDVVAWGRDNSGQTTLPAALTAEGVVVEAIAAGDGHNLAVLDDGSVVAWGLNNYGQRTVPPILATETIVDVAAGQYHSVALNDLGEVTAWGNNFYQQTRVPTSLNGEDVVAITAGGRHSLALTAEGAVTGWGQNNNGQTTVPAALADATVVAVAAGDRHSLALTDENEVVGFGLNTDGQAVPPAAVTDRVVTAISAGGEHSLAVTADFAQETEPAVTGEARGGQTLTVTPGTYTLEPDALTYVWEADGTPIPDQTGPTLLLTSAQVGKKITVVETAERAGYADIVTETDPTDAVVTGAQPTVLLATDTTRIVLGQSVELVWASSLATTVTGSWTETPLAPAGVVDLTPTAVGTTTYAVTATSVNGTVSDTVTVEVVRPAATFGIRIKGGDKVRPSGALLRLTITGADEGEKLRISVGPTTVKRVTATGPTTVVEIRLPRVVRTRTFPLKVAGDPAGTRSGTTEVTIKPAKRR